MMFQRVWRTLLKRLQQTPQRTSPRPRRPRLAVEALEDRLVPTAWFVSNQGNDANPGTAPTAPLATIQVAVNRAVNGDRIHVAQGAYGYNSAADVFGGTTLSGFLGI